MDKNELMQRAVHYYITNKEASLRYVAEKFQVNHITLGRRVNCTQKPVMGRPPALSMELESMLAKVLTELNETGHGLKRQEIYYKCLLLSAKKENKRW